MTFAERHLDILVALRTISLPTYVHLMQRFHDSASYPPAMKVVADRADGFDATSASGGLPDLTWLLGTPGYRDFLAHVSELAPDHAPVVQQVLEAKEYQLRLAKTKATSPQAYLDELRVVTAEEIARALMDGTVVNGFDEHGRPLRIRSDEEVSGAFLDTPTATAYVEADILHDVLADFASSTEGPGANPQGLRLREVVIGGELNLNWLQLDFPLGFEGCDFHPFAEREPPERPVVVVRLVRLHPRGACVRSRPRCVQRRLDQGRVEPAVLGLPWPSTAVHPRCGDR